jgi:hypothetical protein
VRSRHLRLKRNGDQVFIQNIGNSRILQDGRHITGLTALSFGQRFTFGAVTAVVERILPQDRTAAVRIDPDLLRSLRDDAAAQAPDAAAQQLDQLNKVLESLLQSACSYDEVLETLRRLIAPVAAALFECRNREWVLLAELGGESAPIPFDPERAEGFYRYSVEANEKQFLLLVLPFEEIGPWQSEVARIILRLACLKDRLSLPIPNATVRPPSPQNVWDEVVGGRVRAYLSSSTEMCRYCDTVLLLGETGTGKELVARALHCLWGRAGAFVAINCAAVPADLLDAELFGIESGIATGVTARPGRIEQAERGTLFLDEVADLPLNLQTKLLRVLQEREYFSIGGKKLRKADVKIIAASNQPASYLAQGHMRQDLYYRLAQATVLLPALRERKEDLAALCEHFLTQLERQFGRGVAGLSVSALERLRRHSWPGNVRELQNLLRSLYARAVPGRVIQSVQLPGCLLESPQIPATGKLAEIVDQVERRVIGSELDRLQNIPAAARALGLSEGYLYRKIKKLGLKPA